jgi:hypothetical protein
MKDVKFLDPKDFIEIHKKFTKEETWNKKKKALFEEFERYLISCADTVYITSNRDSNTTRVHGKYHFTFFRVHEKQTGNMIPLRGQMVLMICMGREKFTHYLEVYPTKYDEAEIKVLIKNKRLRKYLYFTNTLEN